ncbi:MAG: glycoside hydrolase family 26 protein [Bacteroidales bacterium]|jgi:mannan endo-1,4-beta-mannosidase|nr:glycoside hydrolase family 26 protein [Bacteroidales bacterium]MCI2122306.1 glycoside hydrolase family 26 protein [Bacteroidales bacterium]MCI2145153.1 glycoside hydrolase family 26 protein [Bacteroidales bacterium]
MKTRFPLIAATLIAMAVLTGCPNSEGPETEPVTPEITSVSIDEGAEVEITVSKITILWSVPVSIKDSTGITLNGNKVAAVVQNLNMTVTLGNLGYSSSYTLKLASGAVVNKNDGAPAAEFSLDFSTGEKEPENPELPDQLNFDGISDAPVNSNATAETRNLYSYLKSVFGSKTISGTMANVAYDDGMAEWVHDKTGKWSALTCYDFIFYTHRSDIYSSSYNSWVDYDALVNNAKEWWNSGGIVALMWHWHDPSRSVDNFYCSGGSDATSFDLTAALADTSSTDYHNITADIDTVSRYIGDLQKAGVPVIFRPLHEAEGSYRWGAWFWWGNGQGDASGEDDVRAASCRKLYRLMYDRMVNHNGLNNIIWVWTVSIDDYDYLWYDDAKKWYPGDDVVDIVGIDIYDDSGVGHGSHLDFFKKTAFVGDCDKMVTLAETAFIPSAEDMQGNGDVWLWYMPWYGDYTKSEEYNADYWGTSFSSDDIITRDELPSLK